MFSIVIPTMWKSELTLDLLSKLESSVMVNEIILIDNDPESKPDISRYTKIHYLTKGYNIYVNPAWNWGVSVSKNELIAICNDDIIFNVDEVLDTIFKNADGLGCIGMHGLNFSEDCDYYKFVRINNYEYLKPHIEGGGFGCLMFIKKSNWIDIPKNIKVWFGDNWIAKTNQPLHLIRFKEKIENNGKSATVSNPVFEKILLKDRIIWHRIFNNF